MVLAVVASNLKQQHLCYVDWYLTATSYQHSSPAPAVAGSVAAVDGFCQRHETHLAGRGSDLESRLRLVVFVVTRHPRSAAVVVGYCCENHLRSVLLSIVRRAFYLETLKCLRTAALSSVKAGAAHLLFPRCCCCPFSFNSS